MLGFVNEVKEAVQEYKPQLAIETMVLQNNIEIPSVKYDQAPSHFSPTTRAKTEWLMNKSSKISQRKKKHAVKGQGDRLEELIKQSHKTIRDIETAKRDLLKVQREVMEQDEKLESLNRIYGGYKTNRSQINNGEPPESDKREDTGFLVKAIRALESRLHKSRIQIGKAKHRAEVLKNDINSRRHAKLKAKRLALSWMDTVTEKQDALQSLSKHLHHVKSEINYLHREIKNLKETEHKEAVETRAQIRAYAAEKIKQRAAHRKVLVAPKQISASVRRQKNLKAMQKNQDPNDEEASTDDDLLSNEEDQTILELITKKKENKSLRQVTGSVERYGIADNRSSLGESKLFQQRPNSSVQPRRPSLGRRSKRPSTTSGPRNRKKKIKWHPGAVSSDVSRLDGKPVPTGRRGGLIGKAPGRTLNGKMSARVELLLSRVPNAEKIKEKTKRNILVTKWKLARNQAEQDAASTHGAEEYDRAFLKILEKEGDDITIDKFVEDFLQMEQQQTSLIRQMEHKEEDLKDVTGHHEMLLTELNDLEAKIGISKKKNAEGKQKRMDKLNKQEENAIEMTEKFKKEHSRIKGILQPIYLSLKNLMSSIDTQTIVADLFGANGKYSNDLLGMDGAITNNNVEALLGELESTISEIFSVVTRWDTMATANKGASNRRSVMRAKAASPYARRNLVGGVQDQMQSKLKVQSRSLGTAVENRDLVKEALDQDATSKEDLEVQRFTANSSPTIRKRTAVTSVALPREEEISQTFANEGYDSDDSDNNGEDTVMHRTQLREGAKELYRRRVQIENFMTMQKKKRSDTSARKKLALEKEEGYGSTKGMRFTRRRQGYHQRQQNLLEI